MQASEAAREFRIWAIQHGMLPRARMRWGRLEQVGHVMADVAADGAELRPDVSVGRLFSQWLKATHHEVCDNYSKYMHKTAQAVVEARQYPYDMLPLYIEFVDTV
jgi:hypothetical protein